MQRVNITDDIAQFAGEWLSAALKVSDAKDENERNDYFKNPMNECDSRLFDKGFGFKGVDKKATEENFAKLNAALRQNKDFLTTLYEKVAELSAGMGVGFNEPMIKGVTDFKQEFKKQLLQNPAFKEAWDQMTKVIAEAQTKKLEEVNKNIDIAELNKNGDVNQVKLETLKNDRDALQNNSMVEQMQSKIISGLMFKILGKAHEMKSEKERIDRKSYNQFIIAVSDTNPSTLVKGSFEKNSAKLRSTFPYDLILNSIRTPGNESNLQTYINIVIKTVEDLNKNDPKTNASIIGSYGLLGDHGKVIVNEELIKIIKAIQNDKSHPEMSKKILQQLSPVINEHLRQNAVNSNNLEVRKTTKELSDLLKNTPIFSPQVVAAETLRESRQVIGSSTSMMLNKIATQDQQAVRREKLEALKKQEGPRTQVIKRDKPTLSTDALAPVAPTPSATNQPEPGVTKTPTPSVGRRS